MSGPAGGPPKVDRQTTTPFLLRLFYRNGSFHRLDEFAASQRLPKHMQIYTWPNCTLRELTHLILSADPSLLPSPAIGSRIAYRLIFADTREPTRPGAPGRFISKELGSVVVSAAPSSSDPAAKDPNDMETDDAPTLPSLSQIKDIVRDLDGEPDKTLENARFVIGDYISCAVFPPLADGGVPAAPFVPPTGSGGRGRDLGYGGPRGGMGRGYRENGGGYGRGDYGYGGRGGRGPGGFDGRREGGGVPSGEWRRGEAPPAAPGGGYWRGGGGGRGGRGRGGW